MDFKVDGAGFGDTVVRCAAETARQDTASMRGSAMSALRPEPDHTVSRGLSDLHTQMLHGQHAKARPSRTTRCRQHLLSAVNMCHHEE